MNQKIIGNYIEVHFYECIHEIKIQIKTDYPVSKATFIVHTQKMLHVPSFIQFLL